MIDLPAADRCSPDYDVTLEDGQCPVFKRRKSTHGVATSSPPYCSLVRSSSSPSSLTDLCMDIVGGARHSGVPIILYPCNGGWNQLYAVTDNCSIYSEFRQKKEKGDGTAGEVSERYCIDKSYTNNHLYTVDCSRNVSSSTGTLTFKFWTAAAGEEAHKQFAPRL